MVSMVWSWHPFLSLILFGLPKASLNTRSPATSASPRKCHSKTSHNHIQPAPKPSAHLMDLPQFLGHLLILSNFHRETWSARKSKFQRRGKHLASYHVVLFPTNAPFFCTLKARVRWPAVLEATARCKNRWSVFGLPSKHAVSICKMTPSFEINKSAGLFFSKFRWLEWWMRWSKQLSNKIQNYKHSRFARSPVHLIKCSTSFNHVWALTCRPWAIHGNSGPNKTIKAEQNSGYLAVRSTRACQTLAAARKCKKYI